MGLFDAFSIFTSSRVLVELIGNDRLSAFVDVHMLDRLFARLVELRQGFKRGPAGGLGLERQNGGFLEGLILGDASTFAPSISGRHLRAFTPGFSFARVTVGYPGRVCFGPNRDSRFGPSARTGTRVSEKLWLDAAYWKFMELLQCAAFVGTRRP